MEPREIKHNDDVYALFFSKHIRAEDGIKFFTPPEYPLQIGLIEHSEDKKVEPHIHRNFYYDVNTTQEYLYVEKGKGIKVKIFTHKWEIIEEMLLSAGDSILFVNGGHGLDIPKGCRIFEVKQGPYPGDEKAKIFKE